MSHQDIAARFARETAEHEAEKIHWTQQELCDEARARFGDEPKQWKFICPNCSDIASAADFKAIDADPYLVGRECIGRSCGALTKDAVGTDGRAHAKRGCDWAAYGLFRGPWFVTVPDGDGGTKELSSFRLAPAQAAAVVADEPEKPAKPKRVRTKMAAHAFNEGGFVVRGTSDPMVALSTATAQLDGYQIGSEVDDAERPTYVRAQDPSTDQVRNLGDYLHELLAAAEPGLYRIVPAHPDDMECSWYLHSARKKGPGAFQGVKFPASHELHYRNRKPETAPDRSGVERPVVDVELPEPVEATP